MEELDRLITQTRVSTRSQPGSEGHDQDTLHKERRRQQNRVAQRKYRRKISQQLKQTEDFALRARLTLAEVADGSTIPWRCPECAHCKNSAAMCAEVFNRTPLPSLLESSSEAAPMSPKLGKVTNATQASDLLSATSQEDFCIDDLGLGKMDFEPSFLPENSLDIMTPANYIGDLTTVVVSAPDSALTSNGPPSALFFSQHDLRHNFHQELDQTDMRVSVVGREEFINTITDSSASARKDTLERQSQTEAAVHLAAREGYTAIITILLQNGAGVDARDKQGRTPLHHCAENGHVDTMEVLLDSGADLIAMDDKGISVLLTAVKARQEEVVKALVEALKDP